MFVRAEIISNSDLDNFVLDGILRNTVSQFRVDDI
jgi:hypothetical protein